MQRAIVKPEMKPVKPDSEPPSSVPAKYCMLVLTIGVVIVVIIAIVPLAIHYQNLLFSTKTAA